MGSVPERLNGPDSKSGMPERASEVRILPLPLIAVALSLLLLLFAINAMHDLIPDDKNQVHTNWYADTDLGYTIGYPSNWKLENQKGQERITNIFMPPGVTEPDAGKSLTMKVVRFAKEGEPYSFLQPTCPEKQQAGTLLIDGAPRVRCSNNTSGAALYTTNLTHGTVYYEFTYPANSPIASIAEGIVQTLAITPKATLAMKAFGSNEEFELKTGESARLKDESLVVINKSIGESSQTFGDTGEGRNVINLILQFSNGTTSESMMLQIDKSRILKPLAILHWEQYTVTAVGFALPYGTIVLKVE